MKEKKGGEGIVCLAAVGPCGGESVRHVFS